VRKYIFDDSSRNHLTESERINHIVQECKYMIARGYGFNDVAHMDNTLLPRASVVGDVGYQSTVDFVERRRS
jgi:hypothetical protein